MNNDRSLVTGLMITFAAAVSFTLFTASDLHADTALVPGDIDRICFYTVFFYPFPPGDFFYYLNDRLLFRESPDDRLLQSGVRNKLLKIVHQHKVIKQYLQRFKRNESGMIGIDVTKSRGYVKAANVLNLMGLRLEKDRGGQYRVSVNRDPKSASAAGETDYARFALLNTDSLNRQLNKTRHLYFKLKESKLAIPWDYGFLRKITGLKIDSQSFFETMLKNERFSLLLGILYRLSDREINHIDNLVKKPLLGAWKQIYTNKRFLLGMFVLSYALRVVEVVENEKKERQFQWALPGGTAAQAFWCDLAGADYKKSPLEFLYKLATKDEGKLNYLYLFSTFLPAQVQAALFTGTNGKKMRQIYHLASLTDKEKLNMSRFPRLGNTNLYTLLYALRMRKGRFDFPPGLDCWIDIIPDRSGDDDESGAVPAAGDTFDLLRKLLEPSDPGEAKTIARGIGKFVSLYTKFSHRSQVLTKETLSTMYTHYETYNVLVDFIEKLPIRKPGTIHKLFTWVKNFEKLDKGERVLFTAIFQSILELLSHTAKYAPDRYDYDDLLEKLVNIPFNRPHLYDSIFSFFETGLGIKGDKKSLIDFILTGINNRILQINNNDYKFMIKDIYRKKIAEILSTQEVCSLSDLLTINRLFNRLLGVQQSSAAAADIIDRITDAFHRLPFAEISNEAPRLIRERVMPYSRGRLVGHLAYLIRYKKNAAEGDLISIIETLKKEYLLYQLKDYLLALTYALNAKDGRLRVFLNPNLVRLHDFDEYKGRTAWNHCGTAPHRDDFPGFHFQGGLSRLNLAFAGKWVDHLFSRTIIANSAHVQSVIINLLDSYPVQRGEQHAAVNALRVEVGLEKLRAAREDETFRQEVIKELSTITAGFHYRNVIRYLTGKSPHHHLFFSELKQLGERFLGPQRFAGIYYRTFGNLEPRQIRLFPQDAANFFAGGWTGGEMIDEFKVKSSWILYKKKIPLYLLGQILYSHFNKTAPGFFSQNHARDYFSTYFISDMFNNAQLKSILKNLQKQGYLKLK